MLQLIIRRPDLLAVLAVESEILFLRLCCAAQVQHRTIEPRKRVGICLQHAAVPRRKKKDFLDEWYTINRLIDDETWEAEVFPHISQSRTSPYLSKFPLDLGTTLLQDY